VAGLTRCGKQKFFRTAGSSDNNDSANNIVVNDEGIFVTGIIKGTTGIDFNGCPINLQGNGDIFVAKFDFCGNQQFFLTAGGTGRDEGIQLVVRDNEVFVTGGIANHAAKDFRHCPIPNVQGNNDIFVARLDDLCGKYRSKRTTMTNFPRRRRA